MIILIILLFVLSIVLTIKYFTIRKKIMNDIFPSDEERKKNKRVFSLMILIIRDLFDNSLSADCFDSLFNKEEIFKSGLLKNLILRGFYNKYSLKQLLVIYDILKEENRDNLNDSVWIEPWAQKIMKDICESLNIFTFILYRYKIGRILLVILYDLDAISRNFCIIKDFYDTNLDFIKAIPRQMRYILNCLKEQKESKYYFIHFYQINHSDCWYRKDYV